MMKIAKVNTIILLSLLFCGITYAQDSLQEEIKELKKKSNLIFNEGVRLAVEKEFIEAHKKFDQALFLNPE